MAETALNYDNPGNNMSPSAHQAEIIQFPGSKTTPETAQEPVLYDQDADMSYRPAPYDQDADMSYKTDENSNETNEGESIPFPAQKDDSQEGSPIVPDSAILKPQFTPEIIDPSEDMSPPVSPSSPLAEEPKLAPSIVMSDSEKLDPSSIDDLINVDSKGRGHISGSHNPEDHNKNGQFMSQYEMEQIAANQDLIRDNVQETPIEDNAIDTNPPEVVDRTNNPDNDPTGTPGDFFDWGNLDPPLGDGDDQNTPELGGGGGGGDGEDGGERGGGDGGGEIPPAVQENAPEIIDYQRAEAAYDDAIADLAHAKRRAERFLAGRDSRELLANAEDNLARARAEFLEAHAAQQYGADQDLARAQAANQAEINRFNTRLQEAIEGRAEARAQGASTENFDRDIAQLVATLSNHELNNGLFNEVAARREAERAAFEIEDITSLHDRVQQAMLREKEEAHPRLARFNEFLRTHPKSRIAVGLGLAAAGVVGAATFNAPLLALATAGSAALRGYGSYTLARGIGEYIADRRMTPGNIQTLEDYFALSRRESTTRRRSKRAAVALSTVMVAAPLVGKMVDLLNHHGAVSHHGGGSGGGGHGGGHGGGSGGGSGGGDHGGSGDGPKVVNIVPVDGDKLPWDFGMQNLHTNISDPNILTNRILNNPQGIQFIGNGQSNGLGAILKVLVPGPGGQMITYTDLGHINGALATVLANPVAA